MHEVDTFIHRLESVVSQNPQKTFSFFVKKREKTPITFEDIWYRSARFARVLAADGVKPGEIVAIMLQHCPDLYYVFLGTIMAGGIPTFMPFPNVKQEPGHFWTAHRDLFRISKIVSLITYPELAATLDSVTRQIISNVIVLDTDAPADAPDDPPTNLSHPADVAFLQHTSGTTGLKKGVMLSHAAVLAHIDAYAKMLGFGKDDVVATWLPLYHDMGLITSFLLPLLIGASTVALDPFEWVLRPIQLLDEISAHRATFCWQPNFAFRHIENAALPSGRYDLSSLRALINCSEPCRADTFDSFLRRFSKSGLWAEHLQVSYAMAENVFAVTQTPLGSPARRISIDGELLATQHRVVLTSEGTGAGFISCGRVIEGCRVQVVDAQRLPVADGCVGEVAITGHFLFAGYFQRPDVTAERFVDGWYYTGDLGFIEAEELYITGRKDDLLILYGRNVYAHEIEGSLAGCAGLAPGRAVALGLENASKGSRDLVIIAEREPDCEPIQLQRVVKRQVLDRLGLSVSRVVVVEKGWLIKSTSGKISRMRNLEKYVQGRSNETVDRL